MNISNFCVMLFNLNVFGEIAAPCFFKTENELETCLGFRCYYDQQ